MKRLLAIVCMCACLSADVSAWTHGAVSGQASGQNVVDNTAVLVVDDNGTQVVTP